MYEAAEPTSEAQKATYCVHVVGGWRLDLLDVLNTLRVRSDAIVADNVTEVADFVLEERALSGVETKPFSVKFGEDATERFDVGGIVGIVNGDVIEVGESVVFVCENAGDETTEGGRSVAEAERDDLELVEADRSRKGGFPRLSNAQLVISTVKVERGEDLAAT